ncbi:MAG: hypothetical protein SWK76_01990 [Actinomycetota bacterium]|nr:hypothetical protein [Actinomycetota bacterium]
MEFEELMMYPPPGAATLIVFLDRLLNLLLATEGQEIGTVDVAQYAQAVAVGGLDLADVHALGLDGVEAIESGRDGALHDGRHVAVGMLEDQLPLAVHELGYPLLKGEDELLVLRRRHQRGLAEGQVSVNGDDVGPGLEARVQLARVDEAASRAVALLADDNPAVIPYIAIPHAPRQAALLAIHSFPLALHYPPDDIPRHALPPFAARLPTAFPPLTDG